MKTASSETHLVVIPTYNTGAERVVPVVRGAMEAWAPVWVVVDGSTDGSGEALQELAAEVDDQSRLRVFVLPENGGKGNAVLHALAKAETARVHQRAHHGRRRATPGRGDRQVHGGLAG